MRRRSSLKLCFGALKTLTLFKLHWIGVKIKICHRQRRRQPQSEDPPRKKSLNKEEQKKSLCQNKMLSLITHLFLFPFGKQRWLEWRRRAHGVGSIYTPPIPNRPPLSLSSLLSLSHTHNRENGVETMLPNLYFFSSYLTHQHGWLPWGAADGDGDVTCSLPVTQQQKISKEKDSASERGHHSSPPRKKKKEKMNRTQRQWQKHRKDKRRSW